MIRAALLLAAALAVTTPAFAADMAAMPGMAMAPAQPSTSVAIKGAITTPQSVTLADLAQQPQVTVTVTQQTGKGPFTATFSGAALWPLIDKAGLVSGPDKNSVIRHTIFVTGSDGYQAALSEGELDSKLEGKSVILATTRDGKPTGTIQLIIPGDAHASRSVHDVATIEVR